MGLPILCEIFPIFSLNVGLFYKLLSIPQNIVMDMNNVMQMFLGFFISILCIVVGEGV